jgi:hypothetical protein
MFCMADSADDGDPRQLVRDELDRVRGTFARHVSEMTPADLRRPTNGTDWTNRELLFHMVFGYLVVRRLLPLVKALGHLPPHRSKPRCWTRRRDRSTSSTTWVPSEVVAR